MSANGEVFGSEDMAKTTLCDPCMSEDMREEAVGYCQNCAEYLCEPCYGCHRKPRMTRHHRVLNRLELQANKYTTPFKYMCPTHKERIKLFCRQHNALACNVCITLHHRQCDVVEYIPSLVDTWESRELPNFEKKLRDIYEKSDDVENVIRQRINYFEGAYLECVNSIKKFNQDVNVLLGKLADDLNGQIEHHRKSTVNDLHCVANDCRNIMSRTERMQSNINNLREEGNRGDLFIASKQAEEDVVELEQKLKEIAKMKFNDTVKPKFTPSPTLVQEMKRLITSLPYGESRTSGYVSSGHLRARTSTDEMVCKVTSIVVLPGGKSVLLADYNNSKLKMFNTDDQSLMSELGIPGRPWDIAQLNDVRVAVTVPIKKNIILVKVDKRLSLEKEISVQGECYGIALCAQEHLLVTYGDHNELEIITFDGQLVTLIPNTDQPQTFNKPLYVTSNPRTGMLYVTNFKTNSVVCMKPDGSVVATYTDTLLNGPLNVAVGKDDMVYVCGKLSHNIHKITEDCKKVNICMEEEDVAKRPYSVSYNATKDVLYVGIVDHDDVQIYRTMQDTN